MNWKIVIIFVAAAGLVITSFGLLGLSGTWTQEDTQVLVTKPLNEMLPSRGDMALEWLRGYSYDVTLNASGFEEGSKVSFHKRIGSSHSQRKEYLLFTSFHVYKFSDIQSAKTYYDEVVSEIESEGGYSEVEISEFFAVIYNYGTTKEGFSWGHRSNIVFSVHVYNNSVLECEDDLIDFANLLKDKIA